MEAKPNGHLNADTPNTIPAPFTRTLSLPIEEGQWPDDLQVGEWVYLEGSLFLVGWRAGLRLLEELEAGKELPIHCQGQWFLHAFMAPPPWGKVTGSLGPEHVERYTPIIEALLHFGAQGVIARGPHPNILQEQLDQQNSLYLATVGEASALLARSVDQSELIAYPELALDAIRRIKVSRFPALVVTNATGQNLFAPARFPDEEEFADEGDDTAE